MKVRGSGNYETPCIYGGAHATELNHPCAVVMWSYVKLLWPLLTCSAVLCGGHLSVCCWQGWHFALIKAHFAQKSRL